MRCAIPVLLLAITACGHHAARTRTRDLDDATLIDCISSWQAGDVRIKLWGDHPDYAPDEAIVYRGKNGDRGLSLRYHVAGDHLRLWIDHGRQVEDLAFRLVLTDEDAYVERYALELEHPVFGHARYEGYMSTSYQCKPRDPAR